ncbi:MAG: hypothetical protein NTX88_02455 [Candidatus Atribacteria bacterium]|nr:hypothetical protein [Candidatus Atribacteria bacterium]
MPGTKLSTPQDESIPTPIEEPFSATPPPPSSPFLPEAQKVSYTILTPIFQIEIEIEIEIEEEKEQEEERGCQGGGETLSAVAEPLSVLKAGFWCLAPSYQVIDLKNQGAGVWKCSLVFFTPYPRKTMILSFPPC